MPVALDSIQPKTFEEAVSFITSNVSPEEIHFIKKEGGNAAHFTFGMALRNVWGLWHDSDLNKHFKTRFGLGHADDMSGMILDAVTAFFRGTKFEADKEAESYKEFWRTQGIDPLTQEKMNGPVS